MLFDADLQLVKRFDATTLDGKSASRVSAVYDAAPRHSFVLALKDIPEVWEISYDPKAGPIYDGYVHDYKMGEGIAKPGYQNVRRTPLDEPLDDFFFDQSYKNVLGDARQTRCDRGAAHGAGRQPGRTPQDCRAAHCRHAAPGLGHHLCMERHHRAGQPEPEGRRHRRDRHEDLENRQTIPRPAPVSSFAATKTRPTPGRTR